jgi:hypothetical protein
MYRLILLASATIIFAALLAGCVSYEGAGFSNNGGYKKPACVKYRSGSQEVWGNC